MLRRRPHIPALSGLRGWIERETRLSNPALAAEVAATGDADLALALEWSEAVNRSIGEIARDVPPFPFVKESLASMQGRGGRDGRLGHAGRGASDANGMSTASDPSSR